MYQDKSFIFTVISPVEDKSGSTLPPLDKRAQDKSEDEGDEKIPTLLFKRNPGDKDEGHWPRHSNPDTQARIDALVEANRAAQEIIPLAHSGGTKSKQNTAAEMKDNKAALEKTTVFPLGVEPFNYNRLGDDDETQLLALGQIITQHDKISEQQDKMGISREKSSAHYKQDIFDEDLADEWEFPDIQSSLIESTAQAPLMWTTRLIKRT